MGHEICYENQCFAIVHEDGSVTYLTSYYSSTAEVRARIDAAISDAIQRQIDEANEVF